MSRSAVDATRFTATSPHAHSKPPHSFSPSSTFSPSTSPNQYPTNPPPSPETPIQKVARLRAARAASREAQVSTWDHIVVRGRIWADRLHRFTAIGLICLTVLATGVACFAISDMIILNRRQRNLFYAQQQAMRASSLEAAREAAARGEADGEQMLVLNRERVRIEAERREGEKVGVWRRGWGWLVGGLKTEEEGVGSGAEGATVVREEVWSAGRKEGGVLKAVMEQRREGESEVEKLGVKGGPLDEMAERLVQTGKDKSRWTSWVMGK